MAESPKALHTVASCHAAVDLEPSYAFTEDEWLNEESKPMQKK